MNNLYRSLNILAVITLFISACGTQAAQGQSDEPPVPEAVTYKTVLGKLVTDKEVVDFIGRNNCSGVGQFQLCKEVGIAFWINPEQIVQTVYMYLNKADGFVPYKGELPFGLKFYDTMGAVEYKLERQDVGNKGLPDDGGTPDHIHYWATYAQSGMTVIYKSPFADEDATIYAILISK
jgi:hypothetical protein